MIFMSCLLLVDIWLVSRCWVLRALLLRIPSCVPLCTHSHISLRHGIWNIFIYDTCMLSLWPCMQSALMLNSCPPGIHTDILNIDRGSLICAQPSTDRRGRGGEDPRPGVPCERHELSSQLRCCTLAACPQGCMQSWCSEGYVCLWGALCASEKVILCREEAGETLGDLLLGHTLAGKLHMGFGCFTHQCISSPRNHLFGA